ncbi:hypothetical protein HU200_060427 [Digitaria exilis]|uniref:Cytochrome P450 n=1 Tax=Digitaria exilis TaxID=1010633 RepID=A0A835AC88_9POAL|nr:hypothetical protein HU200_060427 [Digitaria exilis]
MYMKATLDPSMSEQQKTQFLRDTAAGFILAGKDLIAELKGLKSSTWPGGFSVFECDELRCTPRDTQQTPFEEKEAHVDDILPNGTKVTKGTRVIFSLYAMGRIKGIWGKDCLEFRPERWVSKSGRLRYEPTYKFLSFNSGPRSCIGKDLALSNMKLMVSFACFLLLFHRLNRRDGLPTNWPVIGAIPAITVNAGRVHEWVTEFLRRGRALLHAIVTADPANVAHVFTANFGNYPKGGVRRALRRARDGIFNADGESRTRSSPDARFRAAVAEATAGKLRRGLAPLLDGLAVSGAAVDLQDVFVATHLDLTAMFVFGIDPDASPPTSRSRPLLPPRHARAMAQAPEYLKIGHNKRMKKARRVLDESIAEFISLRRSSRRPPPPPTIIHRRGRPAHILPLRARTSGQVRRRVRQVPPRHDLALTWFFWLVTKHPDVEAKILDELRSHPPSSSSRRPLPHRRELKQLVYLHAALSESLRLYPPVPFEHKAASRPDTLPSGAAVGPTRRVIVSFSTRWGAWRRCGGKDCLEFRPERWLTPVGRLRHEPSCKFVAFNVGPRTCLGRDLAFAQMKAVVAAVLPRFRVEVDAGVVVRPKLSIILHMKDGLKVRVHKRE